MRRTLLLVAIAAAPIALASDVQAQVEIGPQVVIAEDVDFGIGAILVFGLESLHESLEGAVDFNFFFPDGFNFFQIDGIARYLIPIDNPDILPFVGAGLGIGRFSYDGGEILGVPLSGSSTDIGLLVGGGLKFETDTLNPFVQLMLGIGDIPTFAISGGLTFEVGG